MTPGGQTDPDPVAGPVRALLDRGVVMPAPGTVDVGADVVPERIAPGVVVHAGSRIRGESTSIGPGSILGREQPVSVYNSQLGHGVGLAGGVVEGATLLDGASLGSGAHVRPGTVLEEQANGAHTVGLKQTILFPFVTLGSLINLCDCLMAGGTSRRHHSEVGSSYVHFNFTPHGDKATASLLGDVPRGVGLDQAPIFLGGQGGLVGPAHVAYGTVIAAGSICRGDVVEEGTLVVPEPPPPGSSPYPIGCYRGIRRLVASNLLYLGNLRALQAWYREARSRFLGDDPYRAACLAGAQHNLDLIHAERVHRLDQVVQALPRSIGLLRQSGVPDASETLRRQQALIKAWPVLHDQLREQVVPGAPDPHRAHVLEALEAIPAETPWPEAVARLQPDARRAGTAWLQGIVDRFTGLWHGTAP